MNDAFPITRPPGTVGSALVMLSARLNYEWALRRPGRPPFIVMTEFPRSGGNWIRDMIGDALQLPVPRFARLPCTFSAVIHNHDHRVLAGHRTVYVYRDGRDVLVSHFNKAVTAVTSAGASAKRVLKFHPSLAAAAKARSRELADIRRFYEEWRVRPIGSRVNWGAHVSAWLSARPPGAVFVRYEDMLIKGEGTLSQTVTALSGKNVSADTVRFAIARNSFAAQTNRPAGVAVNDQTKRRGTAGGWVTDLPAEVRDRFRHDFGDTLALAGYVL